MKTRILVAVMVTILAVGLIPMPAWAGRAPATPKVTITTAATASSELITDKFSSVPKGSHSEQTKVYSPDGGLYQTFTQGFSPVSGAYTVTHEMLVAGAAAETMPGTWTVRVYLDGVLRGTATFQI